MAYHPNPNRGPIRDKTYPSQIAAEHPALVTRIACTDDAEAFDPENTILGTRIDGEKSTYAVDRFNEALRRR